MKTKLTIIVQQTRDGYAWRVSGDGSGQSIGRDSIRSKDTMGEALQEATLYAGGLVDGMEEQGDPPLS